MKKLLLALVAASISLSVFADEVSTTSVTETKSKETKTVTFDSTKMKCKNHSITDGINKDDVKKMRCKNYQDKKTDIVFIDDNSHKVVDCKVDQAGNVTLAKCSSIS